jgi:hypothetical protein
MRLPTPLIPAKAGTQVCEPSGGVIHSVRGLPETGLALGTQAKPNLASSTWVPAFAGMSGRGAEPS